MVKSLITLAQAEQDIADAYDWYQRQEIGLGDEFLRCVDACIQFIAKNPEMYEFAHETYRRALVRRFPYAIFYEYVENVITIYAVFHCSQDPKKWRNRLK